MPAQRIVSHQLRMVSRTPIICDMRVPGSAVSAVWREIGLFWIARSASSGSANRPSASGTMPNPSHR